jgi:3-oxoacyl-[acyl-carrier-protein] synthase-3
MMKVDDIYLAGIGTAKLESMDTAEAVAQGQYDRADWEQGGQLSIAVAGETPAPDLAVEAARYALEQSRHLPEEISAVFHTGVHPQGPDGWSARHYVNRNTINQSVTSLEVNNGCAGFFSTLDLAACYLNASPDRTAALLTFADNFGTPAIDRWRACPKLFVLADGGAAVVLSKRGGFAKVLAVDSTSDPGMEMHHRGNERLFPPGITVGGTLNFAERREFSRQLALDGAIPPIEEFSETLVDAVKNTLAAAGTTMDEVVKVIHDSLTRDALSVIYFDRLGIEPERGIWEFTRRVGHTGTVDHVRGLEHVWRSGEVSVGDKVLLLTSSPGMEAACAVVEITEAPAEGPSHG